MLHLNSSLILLCALISCSRAFHSFSNVRILKSRTSTTFPNSCALLNAPKESLAETIEQDEDDDEALIRRISAEVMAESGVELDQLINPSKVVNLERDIIKLNNQLLSITNTEERSSIEAQISKKKNTLFTEKKAVMRGWLKNLFVGQSVLAGVISYGMVENSIPNVEVPLSVQVLGFWMWWLFIIPSLRARKPVAAEKEALNIAFLASPVVSLALPSVTKDVVLIWWANVATVAVCYAYSFLFKSGAEENEDENEEDGEGKSVLPKWVIKAYKALDYGSGQERGLRK